MKIATMLLALALLAAACVPPAAQPAATPSGEAVQLEAEAQELICRARADLARQLNIAASEIQLDSIQWPTEIGGAYLMRFEVNAQTYEYSGHKSEPASTTARCVQ